MPEDSYMTKYFEHYQKYFEVGPPVFFMITDGYNYSDTAAQNKICGFYDCDTDSVSQILNYMASNASERYYLFLYYWELLCSKSFQDHR